MSNENTRKVLDKGFVKILNICGAVPRSSGYDVHDKYRYDFNSRDEDPAKCARISFDNFDEDRTKEQDMKLVEYLMKNHHSTPMEMTELWFEMKMPIFVARQFVRHRTATINEVSGRYATLPADWYIPEVVGGKAKSNKQGQEDTLSEEVQEHFKMNLDETCLDAYEQYSNYLAEGVAPEHARMFLHLNHYTHWVWKQDLHNLMHFMALRLDSHAQIEAQVYAQAMYDLVAQHLPETMKLFDKYRRL